MYQDVPINVSLKAEINYNSFKNIVLVNNI